MGGQSVIKIYDHGGICEIKICDHGGSETIAPIHFLTTIDLSKLNPSQILYTGIEMLKSLQGSIYF